MTKRKRSGYRLDLVVADEVVVELKAIDAFAPIHDAQLLTYLRLGSENQKENSAFSTSRR